MEKGDEIGGKDVAPLVIPYVSPNESGKGLPYAPVDWPNPGDNWIWRVGHRLSKKGSFRDRYLSVPPMLQKRTGRALEFRSKLAVERYLRSEFPDADIIAFFASFTWEIQAKPEFMQQGRNRRCEGFKQRRQVALTEKDISSRVYGDETPASCSKGFASTCSPQRRFPYDSIVSQDERPDSPIDCKVEFQGDMVRPVSPDELGEGLPYAPEDWPNPGDNWVWRVGHRLLKNKYFRDRYLSIPPRLQKRTGRALELRSKPAVERYLRSEFPNADIIAFFASLTWEIQAKPEFMHQEKYFVCTPVKGSQKLEENTGGGVFKRKQLGVVTVKDEISIGNGGNNLASTSSPRRQFRGDSTVSQDDERNDSAINCKVQFNNMFKEFEGDPSPEEFDNYLKSLDEIILDAPLAMHQSSSKHEVMTDIRKELSSHLAMGTDCLLSSNHVNELFALTYKLQNDPSLEVKELSMLKLIQSIPFTSKSFLEAKQLSSKADKFFDELNAKIALVVTLKKEYNARKDEIEAIQADEAFTLLDIMDIDQQISNLKKKRRAKTETNRANRKKLIRLTSIQTSVIKSLPKLVHEVQIAKSEKSVWELKKKKAAEEVVEILARFAPLE